MPHLSRARVATTVANITIVSTPGQPHPDRHARLQRLRLPHDDQRERRRLQARHGQYQHPDAHRRRSHHRRHRGERAARPATRARRYVGMVASTSTTAGDSRPTATLDKSHPTTGDCNGCHTTTPTFAKNQTGEREACEPHPDHRGVRPVPHHRGQLRALLRDRHAPGRDDLPHLSRARPVATTFANITIVSTPGNHIPIGTLDCNRSGCHTHRPT